MFGKKREKQKVELWEDGCMVYQGETEALPLSHDIILEKSMEFFSDPSPCYIHETAVRIRLLGEIEEMLKYVGESSESLELIRKYSVYSQTDRIVVY